MKFVVGLLVGFGVGVAAGLLLAPQSGEVTREQLSTKGIQLPNGAFNDEIRARAQEALSQGRELYNRTKIELSDRYTRAKSGDL
ncbi:MAG TPA: YtxH domain-containing protein [Dictyobacter sp.]|jgi:gas vesicle protein|nr:YtxH domain-containing protein [Dictyobacter sp.]